ncbi:uncharacterized protein LTR77_010967 [Saxophila tyrrhenica]|uniref:DUF3295 domain-containing protein n=1 Tax=Saxophila tyrrhenica TaxID=1690608 RepID=A0AAV9NWE6_9PEZI|nr:hypothetical protein LTR77_010967 [Saxophila tyrrhenica]
MQRAGRLLAFSTTTFDAKQSSSIASAASTSGTGRNHSATNYHSRFEKPAREEHEGAVSEMTDDDKSSEWEDFEDFREAPSSAVCGTFERVECTAVRISNISLLTEQVKKSAGARTSPKAAIYSTTGTDQANASISKPPGVVPRGPITRRDTPRRNVELGQAAVSSSSQMHALIHPPLGEPIYHVSPLRLNGHREAGLVRRAKKAAIARGPGFLSQDCEWATRYGNDFFKDDVHEYHTKGW